MRIRPSKLVIVFEAPGAQATRQVPTFPKAFAEELPVPFCATITKAAKQIRLRACGILPPAGPLKLNLAAR